MVGGEEERARAQRWAMSAPHGLLLTILLAIFNLPDSALGDRFVLRVVDPHSPTVVRRQNESCGDVPDIPARAMRPAGGGVRLFASSGGGDEWPTNRPRSTLPHPRPVWNGTRWGYFPTTGASLLTARTRNCGASGGALLQRSSHRTSPADHDDYKWMGAVWTDDGKTVLGLAHNEYHGWDNYSSSCKGLATNETYAAKAGCEQASVVQAVSVDGGRRFELLPRRNRTVFASPFPYRDGGGHWQGFNAHSNIIFNATGDGFSYMLARQALDAAGDEARPPAETGTCLFRTRNVWQPTSWHGWSGIAFDALGTHAGDQHEADETQKPSFCKPVFPPNEEKWSWSFNTVLRKYIALSESHINGSFCVHYVTSADAVTWSSPPVCLLHCNSSGFFKKNATTLATTENVLAYTSLLDDSSPGRNFEFSDGSFFLFASRYNPTSKSIREAGGGGRDLLAYNVEIVDEAESRRTNLKADDEAAGCADNAGCSRNGRCVNRACACSTGWAGTRCEQLDLLPVDAARPGLDLQPTSTWGGAVALGADGRWHMMFSELRNRCGINSWLSNSVVAHAVAPSVAGPWTKENSSVFPIFSHEPTLTNADPWTGERAMFFTHVDGVATRCPTCVCADGNSTPSCPPDWDKRGRNASTRLLTFMTHTSDFVNWAEPVAVLPQANPLSDTAFSAVITRSGGLIAMTRTQVLVGDDWRNVSSYRTALSFKPNGFGEGASLWLGADSVHMISHDGNLEGTTCGKHYSAALSDLTTWATFGCAYQAKGVAFIDGSQRDFGRRERPHLVFDGAGMPVALSTAVTAMPAAGHAGCVGKPRCLPRWPDASFTLIQQLRLKTDDLLPGYKLVFEEEFDGAKGAAPNKSRWAVYDNKTHGDLEQQLYVREAVALDGAGHLVLTTSRLAKNVTGPDGQRQYAFTSGWLDTEQKVEIAFGRWEIRARLPDPSAIGIWPAHWLMPHYEKGASNDWNCWPVGGEIDIMEATGGIYNNTVLGTFHWGANCSGPPPPPGAKSCTCGCGCDLHKLSKFGGQFECTHPKGDPYHCKKAHDFSKDFHVFAVEWAAKSIKWFVDGELFWTRTLGVDHVSFIPSQPDYIILNTAIQPRLWNKGAGTGSYPVTHTVDYVRVYEADS